MNSLSFSFWLLVAVLTAWGVHKLWSGLLKPKTVNSILLPGTLVAQLGHVLGLLVTGATVTNTTLYKDDDSGAPEMTQNPKPKIPIVGSILIGMLPLLACIVAVVLVIQLLGQPITAGLDQQHVAEVLPATLAGFWQLLRDQLTLAESALNAMIAADWSQWTTWAFVYLLVCLVVRMAPMPGTLRGSLAASVVLGAATGLGVAYLEPLQTRSETIWGVLSLAVSTLTLLLLVSLLVRGTVGLVRLLAGNR